jgi:WD40 repeat protein
LIAGTNVDGLVVWNVEDEKILHTLTTPNRYDAGPLAFTTDGKFLAEGSAFIRGTKEYENLVRVWGIETGTEAANFPVPIEGSGNGSSIGQLAFSPDDKSLALIVSDQTLKIVNLDSGKFVAPTSPSFVTATACTPEAKTVALGYEDGTIEVWDRVSGKMLRSIKGTPGVNHLFINDKGTSLISATKMLVTRWDPQTGKAIEKWDPIKDVYWLTISPDGSMAAGGSESGKVTVLNLINGKTFTLDPDARGGRGRIRSLAFTPDGKGLLTGSGDIRRDVPLPGPEYTDYTIRFWNLTTKEETKVGDAALAVTSLSVSPDGKYVFANANTRDKCLLPVWEIATGKIVNNVGPYDGWISRVSYSPNGKHIAIARWAFSPNTHSKILLVDRATGKEVATLPAHLSEIYSITYTPESRYLVTGSRDGTTLVFDLSGLK